MPIKKKLYSEFPYLSYSGVHILMEVQTVLSSEEGASFKIPKSEG